MMVHQPTAYAVHCETRYPVGSVQDKCDSNSCVGTNDVRLSEIRKCNQREGHDYTNNNTSEVRGEITDVRLVVERLTEKVEQVIKEVEEVRETDKEQENDITELKGMVKLLIELLKAYFKIDTGTPTTTEL